MPIATAIEPSHVRDLLQQNGPMRVTQIVEHFTKDGVISTDVRHAIMDAEMLRMTRLGNHGYEVRNA